jgi:hypothetical protein
LVAEGRTEEAIEAAIAMLVQVCERNSELTLRLEQMRRERSGRRSEKIDPGQLALMLDLVGEADEQQKEEEESLDDLQAEKDEEGQKRRPRGRARRTRPPKHLPREVIEHGLPDSSLNLTFADVLERHPSVKLGSYPGTPMLVRLTGPSDEVAAAEQLVRSALDDLLASPGGARLVAAWRRHGGGDIDPEGD